MQDRVTYRGKGSKLIRRFTYHAIFTYDEPVFCGIEEVPLRGGYFQTDDGRAEVTQLIGRFENQEERDSWVRENFQSIAE